MVAVPHQPLILLDVAGSSCRLHHAESGHLILERIFPHLETIEWDEWWHEPASGDVTLADVMTIRLQDDVSLVDCLAAIRARGMEGPIVAFLCAEQEEHWTESVKSLDNFILCPLREGELRARLTQYLQPQSLQSVVQLSSKIKRTVDEEPLIGESQSFKKALELAGLIARTDGTVLITGETGTGKDLMARAIHGASAKRDKPFIAVNWGALPEHLVESELFGHVRGAFTGATETRSGLIAEAEGGTLFLDEVDTVSVQVQVKLLRFLQDGQYRPVGSAKSRKANVRVIAATNADLRKRIEANSFREDLFFRLNILPLHLPPLRDRREDIPLLATYFVSKYAERRIVGTPAFAPGTLQKLIAYAWPGNIRELEGVIHRSVILSPFLPLQPDAIDVPVSLFGRPAEGAFMRNAKAHAMDQFERMYLLNQMAAHRGNVSQAAKAAGKERRTFQRLLSKYGLQGEAFRSTHPSDEAN